MPASLLASSAAQKSPPTHVMVAYTVFLLAMYGVYHSIAGRAFSVVMTFSVMFQCLAVVLLGMQSLSSNSASGISAQALVLEAFSLGLRLSSTVWLDGYLPVDKTGDFLFQAVDVCSLVIVIWLLHRVLVVQSDTYQASDDSLPVAPIVLGSLVLAMVLHGDMNGKPFFDTLWMAGLFMGVAQVLPQLWLIARQGCVDALTSHYIAALAISRLFSGAFFWYSRKHITSKPWVDGINHAPWVILGAHACHLLLLADFGYYYGKSVAKQGFSACSSFTLGASLEV
jgi:multisubunit Na+/H+ antiporter MnhC subunit